MEALNPLSSGSTPSDNRREELFSYDYNKLVALFKTLPAANVNVLQGEVDGSTLATKNRWGDFLTWISTHTPYPGLWIGKGFTPKDKETGHGYNRFKILGFEHRSMRFATKPGNSIIDNKPVMIMDYRPYLNPLGLLHAIDEIRQLDDNNYLLCGYWRWPLIGQSQFLFYHIHGPVRPFRED